jgi:triacylglycerol lipase
VSEQRALMRQSWLMASAGVRESIRRRPYSEACVVFAHGFMAGAAVMDPLRRSVSHNLGLDTVAFEYGPLASFERTAKRLASVARMASAGRPLVLVGHSLGGLLARHAVEFESLSPALLLSIATPHRGTERATRLPGSLGRALRPGSDILTKLPNTSSVPHVSIVAGADTVVVPIASAAASGAEVHILAGVGHNEVLFHSDAHDLVCEFIRRRTEL